jgi:predicted AlkP superfamily phosphohydrolase/phosphomutase
MTFMTIRTYDYFYAFSHLSNDILETNVWEVFGKTEKRDSVKSLIYSYPPLNIGTVNHLGSKVRVLYYRIKER